ncbi:MAG: hypothetical protein V2I97_10535 [Desulfococcaceae bacterium]|jgi:hypothetical protein|nr:hypothetical protein [Desulfococcaceae bacterium]
MSTENQNRSINVKDNAKIGAAISGDYANIRIDALNFGALPAADSEKARLEELVKELNRQLQQAPPEKKEEAEAVAVMTQDLVTKAGAEKPNPTLLKITAEGMKEAAAALAGVIPAAIQIVKDIADLVLGMGR